MIAVKTDGRDQARRADGGTPQALRAGGLARHLEGWQPALLVVLLVAMTISVVVPRPVDPVDLPEPLVDPAALALVYRSDELLASAAEREGLDPDLREVAWAIVEYERADAGGDDAELQAARRKLVMIVNRARALGDEPLLRLRAYQTRLFLRELRRWEATGEETAELRDRAGGLLRSLRLYGWLKPRPLGGSDVLVDEAVLRVMFKKRWSEITGALSEAFLPALDEQRVFYRFLLRHPAVSAKAARSSQSKGPSSQAIASFEAQYRLKKIDELARVDPSYPKDLARGIVLYGLGRYSLAVEAFRRHLEAQPDGRFALRAQNYLNAALGRARAEQSTGAVRSTGLFE